MEYIILKADNSKSLEEVVSDAIKNQGFEPHGSMTFNGSYFYQPMVKAPAKLNYMPGTIIDIAKQDLPKVKIPEETKSWWSRPWFGSNKK